MNIVEGIYYMDNKAKLFSCLPKVDDLLAQENMITLLESIPRNIVVDSIREVIDDLRKRIIAGRMQVDELTAIIEQIDVLVTRRSQDKIRLKLRRVINATGTVLHTNLGRALISNKVMKHAIEVGTHYSNLEYDLEVGKRGSRYSHIEDIVARITGAEAALVVNNNAAAVMLVLSTMAEGKEVVVSRGELVEIGGSFRVPDVMEQSGAKLVDVGTTNKTHPHDYIKAIGDDTSALLKVHTSNYRILGFTEAVSLEELVRIGRENSVPVIEDIGSGVLIDMEKYGLEHEPTVQESLKAGVDIVTFSGDKLLGGPQAGIIVGKKEYIESMKRNPLTRAIRVDKFIISILEATLNQYLDQAKAIQEIPTLRMLTISLEELQVKADHLQSMIKAKLGNRLSLSIENEMSQVGGGSLPLTEIPTKVLQIETEIPSVSTLERMLRHLELPIITRIYKEKMVMDLRTIQEDDYEGIVNGLAIALNDFQNNDN